MDILDIFGHFYLNHLSPLWGYFSAKISWKLHENEENWTGGTRPKSYYVDPPLFRVSFN